MTNSKSEIEYLSSLKDDPKIGKPDITRAKSELNWKPVIDIDDGLRDTINYFKKLSKLQIYEKNYSHWFS